MEDLVVLCSVVCMVLGGFGGGVCCWLVAIVVLV